MIKFVITTIIILLGCVPQVSIMLACKSMSISITPPPIIRGPKCAKEEVCFPLGENFPQEQRDHLALRAW